MRPFLPASLATLAALLAPPPCQAAPARAAPPRSAPPALTADGVALHGRPAILLIGTFQPSRTDPSDWDRRLAQFAASGYNTLDCLVPWNFHEPEEGRFDFSSPTHDLPRFLRLCQKHRLAVFLRSGPYVCDEWDGGGLPAWLIPKPGLGVRRPDARFLACVREWVRALDAAVLPYQATRGGPVILSQLENELDFYGPAGSNDDRRTYLAALRDYARQDGLDIPLTACVGGPGGDDGPLRRAMGLADGILPTGNFYGGGAVEARARGFIAAVHAAHSADGTSLAALPVVCSETGQDEAGPRRLLAAGLKGVSPFNFVSGSNYLFNNGDTNWDSPVTYISTSVDFASMISFNGVQAPGWYSARRLAGFVNTAGEALPRASSDTSWEGGFSVSNPALGADEAGGKPRRSYRLAAPNGPQFVFLWNDGGKPQTTTLTTGAFSLPRHSALSVAPGYDQIVPMNLSFAAWGLPGVTLRYATAELYHCEQEGMTTTLTLAGNAGDEGEISLSAAPAKVFSKGTAAHVFADGADWTAAYQTGQTRGLSLFYGPRRLVIRLMSRQELDAAPAPTKIVPRDLLGGAVWRRPSFIGEIIPTTTPQNFEGPDPPTMESAGLWHGAAYYHCDFDSHSTGVAPALSLAHAGDIVTAALNGKPLGTQRGVGNEVKFDTADALKDGRNSLLVRVEVWGHANFDDGRIPNLYLNGPRGMWGPVRLGAAPLKPLGAWTVTPDDPLPPPGPWGQAGPLPASEAGPGFWHDRLLPLTGPVSPTGYVLSLGGKNLLGHLFVNGHGLGRCLLGPALDPHMNGGPSDQFYVPAAWLLPAPHLNRLTLWTMATGPDAVVTKMDWAPVPAPPTPEVAQ